MPDLSENIGLSEVITKIKKELESTNKDSPAFFVETVELELQVTFSKETAVEAEGKAKAELKVGVVGFNFPKAELEGRGKVTRKSNRENIHKIKLTLTPAIGLRQEVWDRLEPNLQQKIITNTGKIAVQGDDDDI